MGRLVELRLFQTIALSDFEKEAGHVGVSPFLRQKILVGTGY
jgi:hypothetical protein